jgi:glycosyltransferase involved in cell wall biosynthesis
VVATDVGGVRDIVRDGETGLLVRPEDAPGLATALVRVLQDRELAARLRHAAFDLARERRFTVAGLLEGITGAYEGTPVA